MELQIGKWGNSLAIRLPVDMARELGVKEGDALQAIVLGEKHLGLGPRVNDETLKKRQTWLAEIAELHQTMPVTQPIPREDLSRY